MFGLKDVKNDISSISSEIEQIKTVSDANANWLKQEIGFNNKHYEKMIELHHELNRKIDVLSAQIDEFRLLVRKKPGRKKKYAPRKKDDNQ